MSILISQSLIKLLDRTECAEEVKHYLQGTKTAPSEAMLCGLYFEHYLIGGCRGGQVPEFKPLKSGAKPKAEMDLIQLINKSKEVLKANNIEIKEVQPEYIYEDIVGHFDAIGIVNGKEAIIDVKWTATRADDKWNGWGNINFKPDAHLQAIHYTYLYYLCKAKKLPFYFLIFGKSGWVKLIHVEISDEILQQHEIKINETRKLLKKIIESDFKSNPNMTMCGGCRYKNVCSKRSLKLEIETITLQENEILI
tara:strand:+ start:2849 stop:3604 length:756 start_codon:yes stop_codon:yes gene_type:complete